MILEEFKDIYLRPYIRLARRHTYLSEYHLDRSIWDHEIIFIEKGSLRFIFDDKEYVAHENECVILRPRMHHKIEWNGVDCEQSHVHFDFFYREDSPYVGVSMLREDQMSDAEKALFREDFYTANGIDIPTVIHLNEPYVVRDLFHRIIDEFTYKMNLHSPQSFSRWFKSIDGNPSSTYLHQVYSKRESE